MTTFFLLIASGVFIYVTQVVRERNLDKKEKTKEKHQQIMDDLLNKQNNNEDQF